MSTIKKFENPRTGVSAEVFCQTQGKFIGNYGVIAKDIDAGEFAVIELRYFPPGMLPEALAYAEKFMNE